MNHTPGPWHYDPKDEVIWTDYDGDKRLAFRKNLASELISDDRYPKEEQLANAHLIAAAPEMLEALIEILHKVGGGFIGSPHWHVWDKARAVIVEAKAVAETPNFPFTPEWSGD